MKGEEGQKEYDKKEMEKMMKNCQQKVVGEQNKRKKIRGKSER